MKTYLGCSQKPIYKYILNSKSKKNRYPLRLLICLMKGVTLLISCSCLGLAKDRNVVVNETKTNVTPKSSKLVFYTAFYQLLLTLFLWKRPLCFSRGVGVGCWANPARQQLLRKLSQNLKGKLRFHVPENCNHPPQTMARP